MAEAFAADLSNPLGFFQRAIGKAPFTASGNDVACARAGLFYVLAKEHRVREERIRRIGLVTFVHLR